MITIKLIGGAKKSFNSDQLQIEKFDISVNELSPEKTDIINNKTEINSEKILAKKAIPQDKSVLPTKTQVGAAKKGTSIVSMGKWLLNNSISL